jgi:hypothetical protein
MGEAREEAGEPVRGPPPPGSCCGVAMEEEEEGERLVLLAVLVLLTELWRPTGGEGMEKREDRNEARRSEVAAG